MGAQKVTSTTTPLLPSGKYTMASIDVDTTGRRLIDEIVQLAAYTPNSQYSQYIMPYMNLNPAARQRHQVRVINIGFYRLLKSMITYKVVKSKSEISALKEFLDWLEKLKSSDPDSKGIVLIYHEERKFVPYMILEAMKKYDLLDRFLKSVTSFANGFDFAKSQSNSSISNLSLRQLSKSLLINNNVSESDATQTTNDEKAVTSSSDSCNQTPRMSDRRHRNEQRFDIKSFEGSASVRVKLAYNIAHLLAKGNSETSNSEQTKTADQEALVQSVTKYAHPITIEIDELKDENENLQRQNTYRPVFLQYFKTTLYHRVKAVRFRIILAENGYDLETLKNIWTEKRREGITEIIQTIDDLKSEEKAELVDLFDSYFDPIKQTIKPTFKRSRRHNRRNRNKENQQPAADSNQGAGDKATPDSTTKTGSVKPTAPGLNNSLNNNTVKQPLTTL